MMIVTVKKATKILHMFLKEKKQKETLQNEQDEMRAKFNTVFEYTNDGFWDYNIETDEIYRNDNYYKMLGYYEKDIVELKNKKHFFEESLHPDDKAKVLAQIAKLLHGIQDNFRSEFRLKTKNGDWKWIFGKARIVKKDTKTGDALRIAGIHSDISELKKEAKTAEISKNKEVMLAIAVTTNHELGQPLSVLTMSIEMLKISLASYDLTEKQLKYFDRIKESLEQIKEILKKYREAETMKIKQYNADTMMASFENKEENNE
jgi:PAS domain S-box-containing protein